MQVKHENQGRDRCLADGEELIDLASVTIDALRALALSGSEAALDELLFRARKPNVAGNPIRKPGRRGRKPGSGSYDALDEPLLDEMEQLLTDGSVLPYVPFAATHVVGKAAGHGTEGNKRRRLIRKYEKSGRPIPDPQSFDWPSGRTPI